MVAENTKKTLRSASVHSATKRAKTPKKSPQQPLSQTIQVQALLDKRTFKRKLPHKVRKENPLSNLLTKMMKLNKNLFLMKKLGILPSSAIGREPVGGVHDQGTRIRNNFQTAYGSSRQGKAFVDQTPLRDSDKLDRLLRPNDGHIKRMRLWLGPDPWPMKERLRLASASRKINVTLAGPNRAHGDEFLATAYPKVIENLKLLQTNVLSSM
ncbi:hypothetical protein Tco_1122632 [Tanacetum coccineum]|uniref:Uncharacterized protein n=1 Tax=Tanacetum coccineum TaxID=301880 RepID=A0ABQ5J139_9ASTR